MNFNCILIFLSIMCIPLSSWARNHAKCSRFVNNGLFKKYKYIYITNDHLTKNSSKDGVMKVSSDLSTENTTASSDTKVSSNQTTSTAQSISFWGDCSYIGFSEQLKKDRDLYIAQNEHEILIDISRGSGEHLKVVTFYSACGPMAYTELSKNLKIFYSVQKKLPKIENIGPIIDGIIFENEELKNHCVGLI